jgi:hypothetical protein
MVALMKPQETILKALRRLGGGKAGCSSSSASQRWKAKRQKVSDTTKTEPPANKEDLLKLTGFADRLLAHGNLEIYQNTYEKLNYKIKLSEEAARASKPPMPDGVDDEDAIDISADHIDGKKPERLSAVDSLDMFSDARSSQNTDRMAANGETGTSDKRVPGL